MRRSTDGPDATARFTSVCPKSRTSAGPGSRQRHPGGAEQRQLAGVRRDLDPAGRIEQRAGDGGDPGAERPPARPPPSHPVVVIAQRAHQVPSHSGRAARSPAPQRGQQQRQPLPEPSRDRLGRHLLARGPPSVPDPPSVPGPRGPCRVRRACQACGPRGRVCPPVRTGGAGEPAVEIGPDRSVRAQPGLARELLQRGRREQVPCGHRPEPYPVDRRDRREPARLQRRHRPRLGEISATSGETHVRCGSASGPRRQRTRRAPRRPSSGSVAFGAPGRAGPSRSAISRDLGAASSAATCVVSRDGATVVLTMGRSPLVQTRAPARRGVTCSDSLEHEEVRPSTARRTNAHDDSRSAPPVGRKGRGNGIARGAKLSRSCPQLRPLVSCGYH